MKSFVLLSSMLLLSFCYASCQQREIKQGHEKNPYYSNTDTSRLNVSNAQWKKILPPDLYAVAREAATQPALPVNTGIQIRKALIIAPFAATSFSDLTPSLQVPADGQVSLNRHAPTV
jgi:hypothetical protein